MSPSDELHGNLLFELSQIRKELAVVLRLIGKARRLGPDEIQVRAAASSLQSIYNGIERMLQSVMKDKGIFPPQGEASHSALLTSAATNGVISPSLEVSLRDLMGFRHFFRHSYGFMVDNELLNPLLSNVENTVSLVAKELHLET